MSMRQTLAVPSVITWRQGKLHKYCQASLLPRIGSSFSVSLATPDTIRTSQG